MATKQKTVKNRIKKESPEVKIWNQSKRVFQTETENIIVGGSIAETTQGRKLAIINPGDKCTVKRAYAEIMTKNYPGEILLLE